MGLIARNTYHIRSTSMPSRSHPLNQKVEENLNRLRGWEESASTSSPPSSSFLCEALCGLAGLYESVEDLLQMPLTQQALSHRGEEKWGEQVLDESLILLDTCGTARDVMLQMKGVVQDLQSALRRRKVGEMEMENKLGAYLSSRRNIKKQIERCIKSTKKTGEAKCCFSPLDDTDKHLVGVMNILREASSITISIFKALFLFISVSKPKTTWKPLGSRWISIRQVACEGETKLVREVERMDASLTSLYTTKSSKDADQVEDAQKHLEGMEGSIQGIEIGLDQVYRRLLQTRVSILNILSN